MDSSSKASRAWHWLVSTALAWLLTWFVPIGGGVLIAAFATSVADIHGWLRYAFLIGVFMFSTGIVVAAGRIAPAVLPERVVERMQARSSRLAEATKAERETNWAIRTAIRRVMAEISRNRIVLQDAQTLGGYSGARRSEDLLTNQEWLGLSQNLAGVPGGRNAFGASAAAHHEFERVNNAVASQLTYNAVAVVLPDHRLGRAIAAAVAAEVALTAFASQFESEEATQPDDVELLEAAGVPEFPDE